jgi:hypothetical protein
MEVNQMSTATRVPWQRLLALLLCMAMVVSFLPATAWATELDDAFAEPVTEPLEVQANENAFTILAASDFQ